MATLTSSQSLVEQFAAEFPTSRKFADEARTVFPGGVTHDLRYLEPFPIYIERAAGAYKWDVDGHELIDYWSGHGALLLGHGHPDIVEAVQKQIEFGTHPGACHESEIEWGKWVQRLIPSAERVRFVSSGTEATMMALRLAKIVTGKPKFLKFAGHFHGWNDFVMPAADPPYGDLRVPGVPDSIGAGTVVVPPNDPEAVERALNEDPEIGCVILEPTGGHMGAVPIRGEFLRALRDLTAKRQRLLIFDEVVTGFRVHPGGAQGHYGVTPDLTALAKILAGGLPGGCVAGREDILNYLEFRRDRPKMKHPGTFNANPLSAAAGIAALRLVATGEPCRKATDMARSLRGKLNEMFARQGIPWAAYGEFSIVKLVTDYDGPRPMGDDFIPYGGDQDRLDKTKDRQELHAFRQAMLLNGVDVPAFGGILTAAHTEVEIDKTVEAVAKSIERLQ